VGAAGVVAGGVCAKAGTARVPPMAVDAINA